MEPTRRFWVLAALGTASAVLAILFNRVLWLGIPLGLGIWILSEQLVFTTALSKVVETPPLEQTLTQPVVLVDETTTLEIQFTDAVDHLINLDAELSLPSQPAITVQTTRNHKVDDNSGRLSVPIRIDVAGTYDIHPPTVEMTSSRELFREALQIGNECSVTGEPRVPRDIHIGTGGERIAVASGEHDAAQGGSGFEPGELREYLPGDPTNRIDWNATARLGEPYVREFDAETTRQTHLVVDRRSHMAAGPAGLTKLDYAREVAVWLTQYVAGLSDPLSLSIVGDEDIVGQTTADTTTTHYHRIRRGILDITHKEVDAEQPSSSLTRFGRDARITASELTDESQFARTLQPYFQTRSAYLERVTDDPLFESVQARRADHRGDSWFALITDDTNRAELFETTRLAASGDTHVSVFLLPSVLFDEQSFTDLENAYADYRDFEEFRQQLAAPPNVSAFEVGPRDRLASLLATAPTSGRTNP